MKSYSQKQSVAFISKLLQEQSSQEEQHPAARGRRDWNQETSSILGPINPRKRLLVDPDINILVLMRTSFTSMGSNVKCGLLV